MPIYEYGCIKCSTQMEIYQSFHSEAPECCGSAMARRISRLADYTAGTDRSPRRRWARDWTPETPPMKIVSVHGEKK